MTKWQEQVAAAERERDVYWLTLTAVVTEKPAHVERYQIYDAHYTMKLYSPKRAEGGFVLTEMKIRGQKKQVTADYLSDLQDQRRDSGFGNRWQAYLIALERTWAAAMRIQQEAQ